MESAPVPESDFVPPPVPVPARPAAPVHARPPAAAPPPAAPPPKYPPPSPYAAPPPPPAPPEDPLGFEPVVRFPSRAQRAAVRQQKQTAAVLVVMGVIFMLAICGFGVFFLYRHFGAGSVTRIEAPGETLGGRSAKRDRPTPASMEPESSPAPGATPKRSHINFDDVPKTTPAPGETPAPSPEAADAAHPWAAGPKAKLEVRDVAIVEVGGGQHLMGRLTSAEDKILVSAVVRLWLVDKDGALWKGAGGEVKSLDVPVGLILPGQTVRFSTELSEFPASPDLEKTKIAALKPQYAVPNSRPVDIASAEYKEGSATESDEVTCKVTNNGPNSLFSVRVQTELFDAKGRQLGSAQDSVNQGMEIKSKEAVNLTVKISRKDIAVASPTIEIRGFGEPFVEEKK